MYLKSYLPTFVNKKCVLTKCFWLGFPGGEKTGNHQPSGSFENMYAGITGAPTQVYRASVSKGECLMYVCACVHVCAFKCHKEFDRNTPYASALEKGGHSLFLTLDLTVSCPNGQGWSKGSWDWTAHTMNLTSQVPICERKGPLDWRVRKWYIFRNKGGTQKISNNLRKMEKMNSPQGILKQI